MNTKKSHDRAWVIKNPNGYYLMHTLSNRAKTSKFKLLDPLEQRYRAIVDSNFERWAKAGYKPVKIRIVEL